MFTKKIRVFPHDNKKHEKRTVKLTNEYRLQNTEQLYTGKQANVHHPHRWYVRYWILLYRNRCELHGCDFVYSTVLLSLLLLSIVPRYVVRRFDSMLFFRPTSKRREATHSHERCTIYKYIHINYYYYYLICFLLVVMNDVASVRCCVCRLLCVCICIFCLFCFCLYECTHRTDIHVLSYCMYIYTIYTFSWVSYTTETILWGEDTLLQSIWDWCGKQQQTNSKQLNNWNIPIKIIK